MTFFSDAKGRKVVATATAETVGRIDAFLVDPSSRKVAAMKVGKSGKAGDTLRWSDLVAFGDDAVTVLAADKLSTLDDSLQPLSGKEGELVGKLVLSSRGDELGVVDDVEFDPTTSDIVALHLDGATIDGVRLIGVGSYAVVVVHSS